MASFQFGGLVEQVAVTATAAGTTTLVNTSKQIQIFTGSTTQTVVLPDATTMSVGQKYEIFNQSSGTLTLEFNGGAAFTDAYGTNYSSISAHTSLFIVLQTNSTSAGTWAVLSSSAGGGANFPTVQKFLSGSGTYTTPSNVIFIEVEVVGGGGGGGGSGTGSSGGTGGTGISSTFGPTGNTGMLTANGGVGATGYSAGTGGTISLSSPAIQVIALQGGSASSAQYQLSNASGTSGGVSPFGGAGEGAPAGSNSGGAAIANSGSGGGGGATSATASAGAGGGAGGYIKAIINNPVSSYSYSVGSGGSGGAGGTSGYSGGNGGSGAIIVTEYYANGAIGTATTLTGTISPSNIVNSSLFTPSIQALTSGTSATYGVSYWFITTGCNATAGAVYTNNGNNFTVTRTVSGSSTLLCSSNGAPLVSGVLTKSSGTGDATITFSANRAPVYLRVRAAGGGGGGSGGGSGTPGTGGSGGTTTFGTSLITCNGGVAGAQGASAVNGGSATIAAPAIGIAMQGNPGGATVAAPSGEGSSGGNGGSTIFGGAGGGSWATNTGGNAASNTGSGGGGGGSGNSLVNGQGGSAGGQVDAVIYNPSATYLYTIGANGSGGAAGTNGGQGGNGGSGVIYVEEFFQ